jgi:hypothetical protein
MGDQKGGIEISSFEIISTPVGVCITFFIQPDIEANDKGVFKLNGGDLVVSNGDQELRFIDGASSRTLQSVDNITLVGVKPSGDIVLDMECEFNSDS